MIGQRPLYKDLFVATKQLIFLLYVKEWRALLFLLHRSTPGIIKWKPTCDIRYWWIFSCIDLNFYSSVLKYLLCFILISIRINLGLVAVMKNSFFQKFPWVVLPEFELWLNEILTDYLWGKFSFSKPPRVLQINFVHLIFFDWMFRIFFESAIVEFGYCKAYQMWILLAVKILWIYWC